MAWAAIILLAATQGCWAQFRSLQPNSWGNGGFAPNPYGTQFGQYGSQFGLRLPWYGFGFGNGCGPCSLNPPPPCQCLQPQASSSNDGKTGLNSIEIEPPSTTTTTTTPPPPPPEKRQPSMPEYIPPTQPPCPQPVQGCSCIPGLLSVACLPVCMQGLFGGQYIPGQAGSKFAGNPGILPQYPGQNANQPGLYNGQSLNQNLYPGSQTGNQPTFYPGQTSNQAQYPGGQNGNQPASYWSQNVNQPLYPGQTINQQSPYNTLNQHQGFGGQSLNQQLYSGQSLSQTLGYGQNLNQPALYSKQNLNPWLFGSQNQAFYSGLGQDDGSLPGSMFPEPVFGTKRSLGQPSQQKPSHKKSEKTLK